jgi:hypothetical protein
MQTEVHSSRHLVCIVFERETQSVAVNVGEHMVANCTESDAFQTIGHPLLRNLDFDTHRVLPVSHLGCIQDVLGFRTGVRDRLASHFVCTGDAGALAILQHF